MLPPDNSVDLLDEHQTLSGKYFEQLSIVYRTELEGRWV